MAKMKVVVKQFDLTAEVKAAVAKGDVIGAVGALLQGLLLLSNNDSELTREMQKLDARLREFEKNTED